MNDFQKKAMERYIELNYLFLSIFQDKVEQEGSDDEKIQLMKQNHMMMRHALSDMGVEFTENDEIKRLNTRIHEIEKQQDSKDFNYQKVSTYINNIKLKLDEDLSNIGIYSLTHVSFGPNLKVSLSFLPSRKKKSTPSHYSSEEEYNESCRKNLERHEKFISNFVTFSEGPGADKNLAYDDSNISLILSTVEKSIGEAMTSYGHTLAPRYAKEEGENRLLEPALKTMEITFTVLSSHRSFIESFSNR